MRKISLSLIICAFGLTTAFSGCRTTTSYRGSNAGDQLLQASRAAGVAIRSEEVFTISRGPQTFSTAPIIGWEQIPATEYRKGVNFAYANVATPLPGIPAGTYTLRATSDVTSIGTFEGRVQFIDGRGEVAGELPAEVEVHSLTVPPEASRINSYVTAHRAALQHGEVVVNRRETVWYRCSNGSCIRIGILTRGLDF